MVNKKFHLPSPQEGKVLWTVSSLVLMCSCPSIQTSHSISMRWEACIWYWCEVKVTPSFLTLCDPMEYTAYGILQARILEWVAFPFSRGSSQPRDRTQVSRIAGRFFTTWATKEAQEYCSGQPIPSPEDLPDPGIEPSLLHCRQILYQLSYEGSPFDTELWLKIQLLHGYVSDNCWPTHRQLR